MSHAEVQSGEGELCEDLTSIVVSVQAFEKKKNWKVM